MRRSSRSAATARIAGLFLAGAISSAHAQEISVSGGVTAIAIETDDSTIDSDQTLSLDLNVERATATGRWFAYVEANSSLAAAGASNVLVEANADAGTALDPDRNGRIQLSEFNYRWDREKDRITLGLLDPSSYLDRSRITNDENVQFLGVSFVNNPTIEFPDYTLGLAFERAANGRVPEINAVLASSNGIADNPNLSYSQLIQVTNNDKGFFGAVGAAWVMQSISFRVGAWFNSRDHETVSGSRSDASNHGVYTVLGLSRGRHGVNLRLGAADDDVTEGARFLALAYRARVGDHGFGVGVARVYLSDQVRDTTLDDTSQIEAFARFNLRSALHLTLSIQRLRNSGFHAQAGDPRRSARLAAVRFHYSFG